MGAEEKGITLKELGSGCLKKKKKKSCFDTFYFSSFLPFPPDVCPTSGGTLA